MSQTQPLSSSASDNTPLFHKILVAIDGSEHSFKAAKYALDLAQSSSLGASIYAITVTSIPESDHLKEEDVLEKSRKTNKGMEDAKSWLDNFNQQAKENNVQLHIELINSPRPVDYVILEYAEEKQIDLIVMGTRGRTGFKKLLLGSTASSVVTYSHCTVMVVK
jgi:nucleotide-binding universal stress UspA family protein